MSAQKVTLTAYTRGDRWIGIQSIGPVTINDATPSNSLTRVRMQFRQDALVFSLDSDAGQSPDAPIVIDNATTWIASVPEVESFLTSTGTWNFDIEFYETGKTSPLTLVSGTIQVCEDVTQ